MDVAADQLRSFVERIERLEDEIAGLNGDKADIYKEAKGVGFDVAALRAVIGKRRKQARDPEGLSAHEALVELYETAIGSAEPPRVHAHEASEGRAH